MGMHSFGAMTDKQVRRLHFQKEVGCVACWLEFQAASPGGEGHHAEDDAGRAIGHDMIIVLCCWHHQGKRHNGETVASHGPSRHRHTVAFREKYGTDLELYEIGRQLLEKFLATFVIRPDV